MRHGLRPTSLAFGALALGLLALAGPARAMPAPPPADTGPLNATPGIERAIHAGEGVIAPEKVTYYRSWRGGWNPYWFYRYKKPRYSYYRSPRKKFYYYQPRFRSNYYNWNNNYRRYRW